MNKIEIKKQLLDFTVNSVDNFLNQHPNLEFYSFAYDCNAEYGEVNLCFNTEAEFEKTLKHYQTGQYSDNYQSVESIDDLKFNTGDWKYQCFESINILTEEELEDLFGENLEKGDNKFWMEFIESLNELFCECLLDFSKTETYYRIPKTKAFLAFCIDHDEDFEVAIKRLESIKNKYF